MDINTKFRGRGVEIRVHPFGFKESIDFYRTDKYQLFNQYMLFGGMPYLLQEDDPFTNLEKGYKKMNIIDFLLDEKSLENI